MGDETAATFLARVNVAIGVIWLASLVGLVVLLAIKAVNEPPTLREELDEPPL
jgi:hypothetical protein